MLNKMIFDCLITKTEPNLKENLLSGLFKYYSTFFYLLNKLKYNTLSLSINFSNSRYTLYW